MLVCVRVHVCVHVYALVSRGDERLVRVSVDAVHGMPVALASAVH